MLSLSSADLYPPRKLVGYSLCASVPPSKAKIKFFSEYGHVAYQMKADDACSNMVANRHNVDPREGVKPFFFFWK